MVTRFKVVISAGIAGPLRARSESSAMDGLELTIHGTGYPLPGGYDELTYNQLTAVSIACNGAINHSRIKARLSAFYCAFRST